MCVTNTTNHRRVQPVAFNSSQVSLVPSQLTQNLLSGYAALPSQPTLYAGQPNKQQSPPQQQQQQAPEVPPSTAPIPAQKPRPKRRRKPQKPGKTAKNHERHFVVHNYHDHSYDRELDQQQQQQLSMMQQQQPAINNDPEHQQQQHRRRGGVSVPFPVKLHAVLDQVEQDGLAHVISWQPHGRCFVIHNPKEFVDHVMPKYFRQTKLTSFQRQLNLYGFQRLTRGADAGGYYNELFLRGKLFLCKRMSRTKVKGTRFKAASSPESEPDFYTMPPVVVSPHHSSDEEGSTTQESSYVNATTRPTPAANNQPTPDMLERANQQLREQIRQQKQLQVALEPLPVQYASLPQVQPPPPPVQVPMHYYRPPVQQQQMQVQQAPTSYAAAAAQVVSQQQPQQQQQQQQVVSQNRVLDEAVDELFLRSDDRDNLAEFCSDWDPTAEDGGISMQLEDDTQLGYMLEKLLED